VLAEHDRFDVERLKQRDEIMRRLVRRMRLARSARSTSGSCIFMLEVDFMRLQHRRNLLATPAEVNAVSVRGERMSIPKRIVLAWQSWP
jgi:hypothetical protein